LLEIAPAPIAAVGALLVAVYSALFARRTYRAQKELDRQIELQQRALESYERYLSAYEKAVRWTDWDKAGALEDASVEYTRAYSNLMMVASDPVLFAVSAFHKFAWREATDMGTDSFKKQWKELYVAMLIEMRNENTQGRSQLPASLIEERLPYDFDSYVSYENL
jgi:hypothetical protein